MKRRQRIRYTAEQRALMWDRYQQGDSLADIARLFDRHHPSIERIIAETGGIRPPKRKRAKQCLSLAEREEISRGVVANESIRGIAQRLSRAPSTICREINRNGGYSHYRASQADHIAWERAKRPKLCKLACNPSLALMVANKLKTGWSPEQISGWLMRTYAQGENFYVSHETIYKTLYIQARGALKKELIQCLRTRRTKRRSKYASLKGQGLGKIVDAITISERPASVEDRAIPGHWEGDLIQGSHNTFIATLVERHSRYVMLVKVENKKTDTVVSALIDQSKKLPSELYKSLTWDRGSEMASHKQFTVATDIQVYFCDPHSPWQRGSNENTNRLLRQYLPKGTDLSIHSQAKLDAIAQQLNERPRKTLAYETPADKFNQCVAATG
jgi:IS30 family transposase